MWRLCEWPFSRRNVRNVNNADSTATSAANFKIVNGTKRRGFRITLGAGVGAIMYHYFNVDSDCDKKLKSRQMITAIQGYYRDLRNENV